MKFIINSSTLVKALDNVQNIVSKKHVAPILANIRLSAESSGLIINATDLDLDLVELLEAEITEHGSTTASASILFETARRLPINTPIEFTYLNDKLHIKCGKFKGSLSCLPSEDFPIVQTSELNNKVTIAALHLKKLLEKTRFAISLDETRYYLNGIYLHTSNIEGKDVLRSVSTDGHRLAMVEIPCPEGFNMPEGIIIPKKTVDEAYKLIDKLSDEDIEISSSKTRISFKFKDVTLTSKLVDGNFPDYTRVIPKSNDKILEIPRLDLLNYVNLLSTYSDENLKGIKIQTLGNKMKLSANKENAEGEHELDIVANPTADITICFNAKYINDICTKIDTENVIFKISEPSNPVLVKKVGEEDEIFVIMPMKL